jgi:hypothetical protein
MISSAVCAWLKLTVKARANNNDKVLIGQSVVIFGEIEI